MISQLLKIKKINKIILENKIEDVLFLDSYGGILYLLNIIENYNLDKKCLIVSSNKHLSRFIKYYYPDRFLQVYMENNSMFLKDYIFNLYVNSLFFIYSNKIKRFFSYKLNIDNFKFYLINIFSNRNTKIIIHDQFIKSFELESDVSFFKKLIMFLINCFSRTKINLYNHFDRGSALLPALNYKLNKKFKKIYDWSYFRKKIKLKLNIKKKSILLIDETTNNFINENFIFNKDYSKSIFPKIIKFAKKNKVNNFYLKKHPTSNDMNFFIKYNFPKLKIIDGYMPIEIIINKFNYVILSVSSAVSKCDNKKIYTYIGNYKFKNKNKKKEVYKFLKKNSGSNYKKIKFL